MVGKNDEINKAGQSQIWTATELRIGIQMLRKETRPLRPPGVPRPVFLLNIQRGISVQQGKNLSLSVKKIAHASSQRGRWHTAESGKGSITIPKSPRTGTLMSLEDTFEQQRLAYIRPRRWRHSLHEPWPIQAWGLVADVQYSELPLSPQSANF